MSVFLRYSVISSKVSLLVFDPRKLSGHVCKGQLMSTKIQRDPFHC